MVILALDVSGAATGWAVGIDGKLEKYGKFIGNTSNSKGQQLLDFFDWLISIITEVKPNIIVVEKPFRGRNSNVLAQISKFIAIVELASYKILEKEILPEWFVDPKTVKRTLKVKKGRNHDENKKLMVRRINSLYGLHLKFIKNKSKKYNDDDMADAIAILHSWWINHGK